LITITLLSISYHDVRFERTQRLVSVHPCLAAFILSITPNCPSSFELVSRVPFHLKLSGFYSLPLLLSLAPLCISEVAPPLPCAHASFAVFLMMESLLHYPPWLLPLPPTASGPSPFFLPACLSLAQQFRYSFNIALFPFLSHLFALYVKYAYMYACLPSSLVFHRTSLFSVCSASFPCVLCSYCACSFPIPVSTRVEFLSFVALTSYPRP
jgi:hypothetical protein